MANMNEGRAIEKKKASLKSCQTTEKVQFWIAFLHPGFIRGISLRKYLSEKKQKKTHSSKIIIIMHYYLITEKCELLVLRCFIVSGIIWDFFFPYVALQIIVLAWC